MDNQEIVFINRDKDVIIVQGKNVSYQDTLENFAIDYGTSVPEYIQSLDICKDTGLKMLNGQIIKGDTPNGSGVITYVDTLIPLSLTLQNNKEARENPVHELTDEEKAILEKQDELNQKETDLEEINKEIFDLMCEDFSNRLQEVQILPEIKEEIFTLLSRKNTLMKEIENLKQQIETLSNN